MTRLARIALALAIIATVAVLISGPGTRFGLWPWQAGLALFAAAGLFGVVAVVAAAVARRFAVLALGAAAAILPVAALVLALSMPRINDVSNALALALPAHQAFAKAQEAAQAMGWEIVKSDSKSGRIDAVATTFWFGFKDDVVVQVAAEGQGSRIEVRSKSRVGKGDSGANAKRIGSYFQRMK
jgi:hypothetical protein